MSSEKPQLTEANAIQQDEIQLAFLEDIGLADNPIGKFETIPTERMPARDVPAKGTEPAKKLYNPANPPEPKYTIDKAQIKAIDPSDTSKGYEWQFEGKLSGDKAGKCKVVGGWLPITQPGELRLDQMTTHYSSERGAKQPGVDISFNGADPAVGKNTARVSRYPTPAQNRFGYDCEIKSYPIAASAVDPKDRSGQYIVYLSQSFVNMGGLVTDKTVEQIGDKDYAHRYATQIRHFEKMSHGQPIGLKQISYFDDSNGATTRKVQDDFFAVKYSTDAKGQLVADSALEKA